MSARKEIIDYDKYKKEIDHWIDLKGETKYLEFVNLLKENDEEVYWEKVRDTYRYDKRLLVNIFKYLSFFEEFLRAQIWNTTGENYKQWEKKCLFNIIEKVIALKNKFTYQEFSIENLENNINQINYLRNRVSHNKIILTSKYESTEIKSILINLKNTLPQSYKQGFTKGINSCALNLKVPEKLKIKI